MRATRRLVHLTSGLEVGGRERVVLDLAHRARREGWDARLVLFDTPFRDPRTDLDPGDLPVRFLRRGPGVDLRLIRELARLLRREAVDLVHAHNDTAVFYACAAAGLARTRTRVCGTFHTRPSHPTRGARLSTRIASRRAARLTAVSEDLATWLVARGWVVSCETIWNGVDLDVFSPEGSAGDWRERLDVPRDGVLAGHVARLDPLKRHRDLVDAARILEEGGEPVWIACVGDGPERERVLARARGCQRLRFVPRVHDVATFLRALDLFVLCSQEEAAPQALLEAMACGRAVVATAVGGVPALVGGAGSDGCARLVPPGRPDLLAEALADLAARPAERAALGARARRRAADFSSERQWRAYARLYEQILAPRAAQVP